MEVVTTRFGAINVDESRIIEMKGGGILGFERLKSFIIRLQDEKTPFMWLQSIEDGSVAFVVINSFVAKPDYAPVLQDEDVELLAIAEPGDVVLLSIVSIRNNPLQVTANLKAPIVINTRNKWARQVIVEEPDYPIQFEIAVRKASPEELLAGAPGQEKMKEIAAGLAR